MSRALASALGLAVGTLRVHVDEAHLNGCKWVLKIAIAGMSVIGQPLLLGAPVGVVWLPHVCAAATEAERLESHRFECDVACEDQQVCPGNLLAVLLLDRPQQAPGLVEVHVVGPAV